MPNGLPPLLWCDTHSQTRLFCVEGGKVSPILHARGQTKAFPYLPRAVHSEMDAGIFEHRFFYFNTHCHSSWSPSPSCTYSIFYQAARKQGDWFTLQIRKQRHKEAESLAQSLLMKSV